jgi:hypothetical protein
MRIFIYPSNIITVMTTQRKEFSGRSELSDVIQGIPQLVKDAAASIRANKYALRGWVLTGAGLTACAIGVYVPNVSQEFRLAMVASGDLAAFYGAILLYSTNLGRETFHSLRNVRNHISREGISGVHDHIKEYHEDTLGANLALKQAGYDIRV